MRFFRIAERQVEPICQEALQLETDLLDSRRPGAAMLDPGSSQVVNANRKVKSIRLVAMASRQSAR